jgi:mitogen-activated protein kinase kinase
LAAKRLKPGLKLSDATAPSPITRTSPAASDSGAHGSDGAIESAFSKYSDFIDTKAGTLSFKNKAIIHGNGIEFSSGQSFSISLDEVDRLDELGKGNYGTVYKVRHSRPHLRKPGLGLSGIVSRPTGPSDGSSPVLKPNDNLTGVVMAMKEIRLELDEKKLTQIIMELDILHRCVSPFIIDFYGAFFQEGAVYMCVEYMDGGSVDRLYDGGVPEDVLRKVTLSTIMGLKTLKDDHNIIHRDVKPTNILANTRGQVKICDFGVSGNLVASIAKTNIGCQSYMAPERIAGGGMQQAGATGGGTYSVQSDIWSLGLSVIECAKGRYPYPPETYNNIFSQLHVCA